jgi:hypothetical protein
MKDEGRRRKGEGGRAKYKGQRAKDEKEGEERKRPKTVCAEVFRLLFLCSFAFPRSLLGSGGEIIYP